MRNVWRRDFRRPPQEGSYATFSSVYPKKRIQGRDNGNGEVTRRVEGPTPRLYTRRELDECPCLPGLDFPGDGASSAFSAEESFLVKALFASLDIGVGDYITQKAVHRM